MPSIGGWQIWMIKSSDLKSEHSSCRARLEFIRCERKTASSLLYKEEGKWRAKPAIWRIMQSVFGHSGSSSYFKSDSKSMLDFHSSCLLWWVTGGPHSHPNSRWSLTCVADTATPGGRTSRMTRSSPSSMSLSNRRLTKATFWRWRTSSWPDASRYETLHDPAWLWQFIFLVSISEDNKSFF